MNLLDLSSAIRETHALTSTGGWVGTLPDGYTTTVDGKKFTVHTYSSGSQVLIHKLPADDGDILIFRDGSISWYNDRGLLHREDGPAVTWAYGAAEYWLHGKYVNKEDLP